MVEKLDAETTKYRVVFDASARENKHSPSLNDCLYTGPPLQNLLWEILVATRFKPIALAGDLKKAFLQIQIREEDRNALQFHWIKDTKSMEIQVLRFARAPFGLYNGTVDHHIGKCTRK